MKTTTLFTALLICISTVSCSDSEPNTNKKTQVAAIVNDDEITVHQLNAVLQTIGNSQSVDENGKTVEEKALEVLINQSLIIQDAKAQKLERDPAIMQAIESAKRKVLVDGYIQRNLSLTQDVNQQDIDNYYDEHPELFSNRKLFIYDAVNIVSTPRNTEQVQSIVKDAEDFQLLIDELTKKDFDYKIVSASKTSENIPRQLLDGLNKLSIGDLGFFTLPSGVLVINLKQVVAEPISKEQASQVIENLLSNERRSSVIEQKVNQLKSKSDIKLLGDFSESTINRPSSVSNESKDPSSHIEKGLQGLK
jgi:EpsD family peptidyl-prolyl cis-trans isomerase